MARVSAMLNTSLPDLLRMPWDEAVLWAPDAYAIWRETWGSK